VQVLDADPATFVAELRERWEKRNRWRSAGAGPGGGERDGSGRHLHQLRPRGRRRARRLGDAITALGGDVWLDARRLLPGDRSEGEILESIRREVRLFVPLISTHTEQRVHALSSTTNTEYAVRTSAPTASSSASWTMSVDIM
jgi:hypothetical protein